MEWGVTISKEYEKDFLAGKKLEEGTSREVTIVFDGKKYPARLGHIKRPKYGNVYQIRWDSSRDLLEKLRRSFIQSYVVLKAQKELFDSKKGDRKFFRSKLSGKQQEVLEITPISYKEIKLKPFIQVEDEWNPLFERLADQNVFGWLFEKDRKHLISHSSKWYKVKDFSKHAGAVNVVYYLSNSRNKTLYIGKAEVFGKRVRPGRKHQSMEKDWDMFRYDVVHNEFAGILDKVEDHTIRSVASILNNTKSHPTLGLSDYKLVNRNWRRL